MVDDRLDDPIEPGRPKRPPPTLELSANEDPATPADESVATDSTPGDETPRRPGLAAAALTGACSGALVAALAWFAASTWLTATPEPQPATVSNVNAARIDDLTTRLSKVEARPVPAAQPPADLSKINARLDALDKANATFRDDIQALRAQVAQALSAASEAQKGISAAGGATPSAAPDLSAVTTRLAQLEAAVQGQNAKIAEQARKSSDDIATRRIAAASLLDAQVRAGEPYAAALAAATALSTDPARLAPLQPFAATGVPSATALSRALLDMPQVTPPPTATSGGLIDRIRAGAARLVKIERTDLANGDNADLSRAAEAARRDDLAAAVKDLATLPAAERAALQPWLDRVAARDAARAASRQFANDALAAMPK